VASGGGTKVVGAQTWTFPSRNQCMECHTAVASFSLGPETGQLNGDFTYPNGRTANQLATFEHVGLFDAPLGAPVSALVRFPRPGTADGTAEGRSKAYFHANCSHCHRPGGVGLTNFDMRYYTPFAQMGLCSVGAHMSMFGTFYVSPGQPGDSAVIGHMSSSGKGRMPPLATDIVDSVGVQGSAPGSAP
jgi:mono/diheme cytochrome c family protein